MQFFSRPDACLMRCGDLRCAVVERHIPGAPGFMRGLRAVFVTDVHARPWTIKADIDALTDRILGTKPDIVLLGGDYADTAEPSRRLFDGLRRVTAPLGLYGVAGNNDREAFPDIEVLRRVMSNAGMVPLINEAVTLRLGGGRLIIAGLDEYKHGAPDPSGLYPEAPRPDRFRLLLSHFPVCVTPAPDLMLSGHTHGGQFNLLGITPYTVGFERVFHPSRAPAFISGLHDADGGRVFVSKGIGASRVQLRVCVRPEIDLLVFD